ncbi:MAG: GDP-mannose 4,6-dehydratase [Gemmatimonadota bacterium]|nr:GDP-mannose 4,6-dehydratase [Gemmatimonadota bacterium]MDQ6888255.1 GDP-mannose 4,6-dehydratase [Gemmatimonadota bacterium]
MTRRALVTGGAGFIGSHVADRLLATGHEVTIIDDLSSGRREQLPDEAAFHELSVSSDAAASLVRESRFDVLFHLAAQIDVRKSVHDPRHDARVNIEGTLNLLEAIRCSGAGTRFVFSSTGGAIYGDLAEPPTSEDAPKNPQSPYGAAKLSVEYYLGYYARVHGLESVTLRYANVYGPRQDPHGEAGVVSIFCNRVLEQKPLTVFGDGRQTRDYVYVEDVARANVLAADIALPPMAGVDSRSFNIGTSVETSVLELARLIGEVAGRRSVVEHAVARPGEQLRSAVEIVKAARGLGWRPEVPLAEGLRRAFEWFAGASAGGEA